MNRQPYQKPPRWWPPRLSTRWIRLWRPFRLRRQRSIQRLLHVDVDGVEHVEQALEQGSGVLITPNHCSHADPYSLYQAADRLKTPLYVMVAWQVFDKSDWLTRLALQHHGCFSIDREGTDINALRQAREVLQSQPYPLVIFPEGEVYHLNDRIRPFRDGPAAIASLAAKKASRPIVIVPCAIKYRYTKDPTAELTELMTRLEQEVFWRPRTALALPQRIYQFAEGLLALKEIEFLGKTFPGTLPERIGRLIEYILGRVETRYELHAEGATIPDRVKAARRRAIERLGQLPLDDPQRAAASEDLDDLFLVVQAYSYPGDYVAETPSLERMAETLDKFEEDVLGVKTATIRGARSATVRFAEPISLAAKRGGRNSVADLTRTMELGVQALLDDAEGRFDRAS